MFARERFGTLPSGETAELYRLSNGIIECEVLSFGAVLRALKVPGRNGPVDIALGFDSVSDYLKANCYAGAVVGRFANRIGNSSFSIDGTEYILTANEGRNQLHGGFTGFDKLNWALAEAGEDRIRLSITSPDGDEGFPGNLDVSVAYILKENRLVMEYRAVTDRPTPVNLTNHGYYDLDGQGRGSIIEHFVRINASSYLPTDDENIPTGEIAPVEHTPMDLRHETRIADRIFAGFPQLSRARGFDHCYAIDSSARVFLPGCDPVRFAASVRSEHSGIIMNVYTNMPGIQFYTGNYLLGTPAGKEGKIYCERYGLCLETEEFPDAPNKAGFPSCILYPGEEYRRTTIHEFITQL